MTRNNAREIAVHLVFGLGFGARSAEEVLKSELSRERFETLGQESPLYAQYPNEKQRDYIRALVEGVYALHPALRDFYRLRIFLEAPWPVRRARLLDRGGPELLARFQGEWVPLEDRYFQACRVRDCCQLVLSGQ